MPGKTTVVEQPDGSKAWYRDGTRHRDDGPAIESADGYKAWYRDGTLVQSEVS